MCLCVFCGFLVTAPLAAHVCPHRARRRPAGAHVARRALLRRAPAAAHQAHVRSGAVGGSIYECLRHTRRRIPRRRCTRSTTATRTSSPSPGSACTPWSTCAPPPPPVRGRFHPPPLRLSPRRSYYYSAVCVSLSFYCSPFHFLWNGVHLLLAPAVRCCCPGEPF